MKERENTGWIQVEGFRIPYNYAEDSKKYIIADYADKLDLPVLIMHGDQDDNVPLSQSKKLVAGLSQGELIVFPGEGHSFKQEINKQKVQELTVEFMKDQLL